MPGDEPVDERWRSGATSGDKPVDAVDNSVTQGRSNRPSMPERDQSAPRSGSPGDPVGGIDATDGDLHGSDLARAALQAARDSAKARGRSVRKGTGQGLARRRRRWSGPRPDDRDPQPLGRLTARMMNDRGWNGRLAGGQVFDKWAGLVGADVAEHTRPVQLSDGELTVRADSTAWATQLRLLQRQLVAKIAAGVGAGVVTRLRVQGPAAPSWRHGPRHVPGRGPRDTYG